MTETKRSELRLPAALIIMDGFGCESDGPGNAISRANTPNIDALAATCPHIRIHASEKEVGLPDGQMGNSEVGHLNIGAGRVIFQELTRINNACRDGSLKQNPVLTKAMDSVITSGGVLHLMGLLSDGGVHSSDEHLRSLLQMAVERNVPEVYVHCFMDGRDVPPSSGAGYIERLEGWIEELNDSATTIRIASIEGRYYAMDRDNRWDRVERAYRAIVSATPYTTQTAAEVMSASYAAGVTDEFVEPVSLVDRPMGSDDQVVFFNFRPDRAREITRALIDEDFSGFARENFVHPGFVCMTEYDATIDAAVAFPKEFPDEVLADVLAEAGLTQYHIAETEKYAHVTFFLNGGREEPKAGEKRVLVPSPKVATYDMQPEMSEPEVASTLAAAIRADEADVYIVNFANCDMVGHTGVMEAAVAAVEAVDSGVGEVLAALKEKGGCALITADHGNADKMIAEDGEPFTAHTTALVPLILADFASDGWTLDSRADAALCNLAPTLLDMVGIAKPTQMSAASLLVKS